MYHIYHIYMYIHTYIHTYIHMWNGRSRILIVTRTKWEQMSLKFGKTIRTLWLSQNYLVLIKIKSVSDKPAQTSNVILLSTTCLLIFRLEVGNKKPLFTKPELKCPGKKIWFSMVTNFVFYPQAAIQGKCYLLMCQKSKQTGS